MAVEMRYVFILSLDHSRSTIIDLSIADRLGGISLGEVRRVVSPSEGERKKIGRCSCGEVRSRCNFWSRYAENFELLFTNSSLENRTLIDSSKEIQHFQKFSSIAAKNGVLVDALVVVRTFSEWFESVSAANRRHGVDFSWALFKKADHKLALIRLLLRRVRLIAYLEWLITNVRLIYAARSKNSYLITENNDLDEYIDSLTTSFRYDSEQHILRGNRLIVSGGAPLRSFSLKPYERKYIKAAHHFLAGQ